MDRIAELEARVTDLERRLTAYKLEHKAEHSRLTAEAKLRHSQLAAEIGDVRESVKKAIGDLYETLGTAARDLGGKADSLSAQGNRLEVEAGKIKLQGHFLARIGLLVVFGAAIGGGAFQGAVWWWAHKQPASAATVQTN